MKSLIPFLLIRLAKKENQLNITKRKNKLINTAFLDPIHPDLHLPFFQLYVFHFHILFYMINILSIF